MKKKIVIFLSLFIIVLLSWNFYQQQTKTVECWWGVMYPSLSFIGFEDNTKVSSTDEDYIYTDNKVKMKFAIVEWLKGYLF